MKTDFDPVVKSQDYWKDIGVTGKFTGAFQLSGEDLAEFIPHLLWIIRCNASLPYCWFSASKLEFVGDIFKYGTIHFRLFL